MARKDYVDPEHVQAPKAGEPRTSWSETVGSGDGNGNFANSPLNEEENWNYILGMRDAQRRSNPNWGVFAADKADGINKSFALDSVKKARRGSSNSLFGGVAFDTESFFGSIQ